MNKNNLETLTNAELARLFFRELWQGYDSGGISCGRSMRSVLLEIYLDLVPIPDVPDMADFYGYDAFCKEAGKQKRRLRRQRREQELLLPFPKEDRISLLSASEVALLCLACLLRWYKDSHHLWEQDWSLEPQEKRMATICRILPLPKLEAKLDILELQRLMHMYARDFRNYRDADCTSFGSGWARLHSSR